MNLHPIQTKLLKIAPKLNTKRMSLREIANLVEEKHPETVRYHLDQLEKKGFVNWDRRSGGVRVLSARTKLGDIVLVPIYGVADCGEATCFGEQNFEGYLRVSRSLLGSAKNLFAVRANGSSMNRAKVNGSLPIEEDDYVLIDPNRRDPSNGDYVLSIIDGLANIKKFIWNKREKQIALVSESTEKIPPIIIDEEDYHMINGLVTGVIRMSSFNEMEAFQEAAGQDALRSLGPMSKEEAEYYRKKRYEKR